jgi:phosphoglycerol transferase MdoB-like AlkP superfamily enzyme
MNRKSLSLRVWLSTALGVVLGTPFVSSLYLLPVRWWVTTIAAGVLGSQIAVGLLRGWPYWVVALLVLALCVLLFFGRRWVKRDRAAATALRDSDATGHDEPR